MRQATVIFHGGKQLVINIIGCDGNYYDFSYPEYPNAIQHLRVNTFDSVRYHDELPASELPVINGMI